MNIVLPKYLHELKPYTAGKTPNEVQKQYGIARFIKLASNENPLGPSPKAMMAIKNTLKNIHCYPDSKVTDLRHKIATIYQIMPEQIVIGNGSDEIMGLVGQALLLPGEEVIIPYPSFSIYEKVATLAQATLVKVPLRNLAIDLKAIKKKITKKTKLIFLTNPHNPTGSFLEANAIHKFLESIPSSILVVLDEAYVDFVSPKKRFESVNYLKRFPNLILLRTFSKAYGLAGLRVGYGLMSVELAGFLEAVRYPFNVNSLAQVAALAALEDKEFLERTYKTVWEGRNFLFESLTDMGVKVYPSEANFLLIYVGKKANEIYKALLKRGIIIRPLDSYDMPEYFRISIGKPEENQLFIEIFKELWQR